MNKKIVTLILVILISFCFLSIVVADNASHGDNNSTDGNSTIDNDDNDTDNDPTDKDKTDDKDKKDDKNADKNKKDTSKKKYILAKGKGNDIKFSDGFRGFILDYSKSPASSGDEFKSVSASKASNSNTLKLAIIECYKQDSTDNIGKIIADFVKTGSSNSKVGKAVADSHEKVGNHAVVKIDKNTEAVFDFEVLKSVSGNESDYFAYKVSFKSIDDDKKDTNQSKILVNVTNATNVTAANVTNTTANVTNATNATANVTQPVDNQTNATFLKGLYDYLALLLNSLYDAWKPVIDTLLNYFLMMANALEELTNLFENLMMELHSLMDALQQLLDTLGSIWAGLAGLLKLFGFILTAIEQLLNLIGSILNFIVGLISAIISLIQQLLGLLFGLIDFIIDLINQLISMLQAILDFLKSIGSSLVKVIGNAVFVIVAFVIIAVGAFVYNRIR